MLNGRGRYRLRFVKQKVLLLLLFGPLWSIERREQQACVRGVVRSSYTRLCGFDGAGGV